MTTSRIASKEGAKARQMRVVSDGLAYAATPAFALMALISMNGTAMTCSSGPGALPVGAMTTMYLLMSLFHLPPWLRLASNAGRTTEGERP